MTTRETMLCRRARVRGRLRHERGAFQARDQRRRIGMSVMIARQGMQLNSGALPAAEADSARRGLLRMVAAWFDRARRRADLPHLDARMLRDIGITPDWLERESPKPFWAEGRR